MHTDKLDIIKYIFRRISVWSVTFKMIYATVAPQERKEW